MNLNPLIWQEISPGSYWCAHIVLNGKTIGQARIKQYEGLFYIYSRNSKHQRIKTDKSGHDYPTFEEAKKEIRKDLVNYFKSCGEIK